MKPKIEILFKCRAKLGSKNQNFSHKPNGRKEEAAEAKTTFLDRNFGWGSSTEVDFVGFVKPVHFQVGLVANDNDTPVVNLSEVG